VISHVGGEAGPARLVRDGWWDVRVLSDGAGALGEQSVREGVVNQGVSQPTNSIGSGASWNDMKGKWLTNFGTKSASACVVGDGEDRPARHRDHQLHV
jgi:hypothetical protein